MIKCQVIKEREEVLALPAAPSDENFCWCLRQGRTGHLAYWVYSRWAANVWAGTDTLAAQMDVFLKR